MALLADPIAALRAGMLANADIALACQNRVYGESLPADDSQYMPRSCVVIKPSGGKGLPDSYQQTNGLRVQVRAYGQSDAEAYALQSQCMLWLQGLTRRVIEQTMLYKATNTSGANYHLEQPGNANWPCYYSIWVVESHLITVV